jgi:hypothetical protein
MEELIMEMLSRSQIIDAAKGVRNGTIARVTYKTQLPVKSEFKKEGYNVFKIVQTSGRLGVNYHNIANVIARKNEMGDVEPIKRANNYEWVVENKVKYNNKTQKHYLVLANFNKGHHTKSLYIVYHNDDMVILTREQFEDNPEMRNLIINSHWTPSKTGGEVRNISFENIIAINNVGTKIKF